MISINAAAVTRIDGGDRILVARSRDGVTWSAAVPLTEPGDHFRVALAEDGRGRIWCVYGLQKQMESGNFDLYARDPMGVAALEVPPTIWKT